MRSIKGLRSNALLALLVVLLSAKADNSFYVRIETAKGSCIVRLFDETPRHRDNFLKLVQEGKYDSLLFHRVIKGFMIQGGDPDSRSAKPDQRLGDGDVGYTVSAEFSPRLIHKKGALAAARDENPLKASSGIQFYLVQGRVFTSAQLDSLEVARHIHLSELQRKVYTTVGGTPHLDQNYTVYGEVVEGLAMIDSIAAVQTGVADRPVQDIPMKISVLSRHDVRRLLRRLKKRPAVT